MALYVCPEAKAYESEHPNKENNAAEKMGERVKMAVVILMNPGLVSVCICVWVNERVWECNANVGQW